MIIHVPPLRAGRKSVFGQFDQVRTLRRIENKFVVARLFFFFKGAYKAGMKSESEKHRRFPRVRYLNRMRERAAVKGKRLGECKIVRKQFARNGRTFGFEAQKVRAFLCEPVFGLRYKTVNARAESRALVREPAVFYSSRPRKKQGRVSVPYALFTLPQDFPVRTRFYGNEFRARRVDRNAQIIVTKMFLHTGSIAAIRVF